MARLEAVAEGSVRQPVEGDVGEGPSGALAAVEQQLPDPAGALDGDLPDGRVDAEAGACAVDVPREALRGVPSGWVVVAGDDATLRPVAVAVRGHGAGEEQSHRHAVRLRRHQRRRAAGHAGAHHQQAVAGPQVEDWAGAGAGAGTIKPRDAVKAGVAGAGVVKAGVVGISAAGIPPRDPVGALAPLRPPRRAVGAALRPARRRTAARGRRGVRGTRRRRANAAGPVAGTVGWPGRHRRRSHRRSRAVVQPSQGRPA